MYYSCLVCVLSYHNKKLLSYLLTYSVRHSLCFVWSFRVWRRSPVDGLWRRWRVYPDMHQHNANVSTQLLRGMLLPTGQSHMAPQQLYPHRPVQRFVHSTNSYVRLRIWKANCVYVNVLASHCGAHAHIVFFYCATLRRARYCFEKMSVRPSICPSVCDVEVSWSHRLEYRYFENNFMTDYHRFSSLRRPQQHGSIP